MVFNATFNNISVMSLYKLWSCFVISFQIIIVRKEQTYSVVRSAYAAAWSSPIYFQGYFAWLKNEDFLQGVTYEKQVKIICVKFEIVISLFQENKHNCQQQMLIFLNTYRTNARFSFCLLRTPVINDFLLRSC